MKNSFMKLLCAALLACAIALPAQAQEKEKRAPFHGKLSEVDAAANTVAIQGKEKKRVFVATSQTRITRDGKPATIADAKVGDEVGGFAKELSEGKWELISLRIGPKPETAKSSPAGGASDSKGKKKSD